jgi:hypothetical protein
MKTTLWLSITSALVLLGATKTSALTLYDGSAGPTSPLTNQGWLRPVITGVETVSTTGTTLDTTGNFAFADGYSYSTQTLDRTAGYNLRFDFQVNSEDHSAASAQKNTAVDMIADRAGTSLVVLSSDQQGIELGFWTDRIWAQADGPVKAGTANPSGTRFTQAEGAAFNTQTATVQYDLSIKDNTYYLYVNQNYAAPLLTGSLRNYAPEGVPYTTPNFIYIGDNTTSAKGSVTLNRVEYSNTAIVPVPFAFNPLLGLALTWGVKQLRRKS